MGPWTREHCDHVINLHDNGIVVCLINRAIPDLQLTWLK